MKKLLCFLLSCLLVFNSVSVVYADTKSSFNPYEQFKKNHPDWYDSNGNVIPAGNTFFSKMVVPALIEAGETSGEIVSSLVDSVGDIIKSFDNSNGDVSIKYKDNGQPVTENNYNENNFYITYSPKFLNELNDKLQTKVHALDGYYLYTPVYPNSDAFIHYYTTSYKGSYIYDEYWNGTNEQKSNINAWLNALKQAPTCFVSTNTAIPLYPSEYYYWHDSGRGIYRYDETSDKPKADFRMFDISGYKFSDSFRKGYITDTYESDPWFLDYDNPTWVNYWQYQFFGKPLRVFYSLTTLKQYLANDKKRSYAPKLPSTDLTIPLGYVNGTLNLPDFNINLDSLVGKAELEIQNDIDNQFKLYLDKLAEINVNPPQPTNPTPTPSGGGSGGDFGDGTTPTPAPDFTDGLKDTNDYLKQILEKVTSILQVDTEFSKSFETVSQNLCKYLESNNEKLDQIITAINALSNGKTEDEVNGCKYDFTQLSQSLTSLWNDSDQKFDQMIKLLEENNKYQEKIIGDLNDIKAILIAQTVLDAFQNRSQETANKAKEKFPTSIPWDIAMIVNTFSAEPEPIKFELPIKVNSLNINETITVDLSTGEWEKLGKLCRYMLSVLFILFLIQLSRKLFSNGGDE